MELAGKKVLVVGLGKTGEAVCRFLLKKAARVTVTEAKPENQLGRKPALWRAKGVSVRTGGHAEADFLQADLIIPSPGVPPLPELRAAQRRGIPVLSELELAFRFLQGEIIGITGSNGKSTTASLAYALLKEAELPAYLAGNIGTPLISFVNRSRPGHLLVTEISSFQLHFVQDFHAPLSVFLNISSNHLDWHGSFEEYYRDKKKLFLKQGPQDTAILNRDDPLVWSLKKEGEFQVVAFSRTKEVKQGCFFRNGWIYLRDGKTWPLLKGEDIPLPGEHNRDNVMAASLIAYKYGVSLPRIRKTVRAFRGLEHRLESVLTIRGVRFVNDSKATTVDATLKALESFPGKIVLILGGRDKGGDFTVLRKSVRKKTLKVLLLGEAKEKIRKALAGAAALEDVPTLRAAVERGWETAGRGGVVLLAPACASFDMFKNYEHRGRVFKEEVRRLAINMGKG